MMLAICHVLGFGRMYMYLFVRSLHVTPYQLRLTIYSGIQLKIPHQTTEHKKIKVVKPLLASCH